MFDKIVILDVNQRVRGSEEDQTIFNKGILSRLRSGEVSVDDWKLMLTRQPSVASNVDDFLGATRLYYSNEEVEKYNYNHLLKLHAPIAEVHARHSSQDAKHISAQDMVGLHPIVLIY